MLRAALAEAKDDRGQVAMPAGEPGIGKTRTAQELARHVKSAALMQSGRHFLFQRQGAVGPGLSHFGDGVVQDVCRLVELSLGG